MFRDAGTIASPAGPEPHKLILKCEESVEKVGL